MTKFCESLAEHTMETISFRKKLLINKEQKLYENAKICCTYN